MPYKKTIEALKPGQQFYFQTDPEKNIYTKLKDERKTGTRTLFFCEKQIDNTVDEFYEDRSVMCFHSEEDRSYRPVEFGRSEDPAPIVLEPKPTLPS